MNTLKKRAFARALDVHKALRTLPFYAEIYGQLKVRAQYGRPGRSMLHKHMSRFCGFYETAPLKPRVIVYEAFHGSAVACHPAAIYRAARADPRFAGFQHVWVLDDPAAIPASFADRDDTITITRQCDAYPELLATAQYLVNNSTFPSWYLRRDGQIYLNTWHGTPLKTMFSNETGPPARFANSQRNFLQASHIIMSSDFATDHLLGSAQIAPLCRHKTWQIGTPRLDQTLYLRKSWVPDTAHRHILFAPTWKGSIGAATSQIDEITQVARIVADAAQGPTTLHVKAHNFNDDDLTDVAAFSTGDLTVTAVDPQADINAVMAHMDVVITDYSSLLFDALAADIPVILFTPDLDAYQAERGLYIDLHTLPLRVCADAAALRTALQTCQPASAYPQADAARQLYYPDEDGQAASRVLDVLLGAETAPQPIAGRTKPVLAIMAGAWKQNGITTSALNLLSNIDHDTYDVVVLTDGAKLSDEAWPQIAKAHPDVMFVHRVGRDGLTFAEAQAASLFYQTNRFRRTAQSDLMARAMRREGRRILGDTPLRAAIEFSGYRRFWVWVMAMLPADKKIVYQHNDMHAEMTAKFPSLLGLFRTYARFDHIVSVSEETRQVNDANLSGFYAPGKTRAIRNSLNIAAIKAAATQDPDTRVINGTPYLVLGAPDPDGLDPDDPEHDHADQPRVDIIPPVDPDRINFITLGRASDEKNHAMLLRAFKILRQTHPQTHLYLLGDGPLMPQTRVLRDELGLQAHATLPGFSPYALRLVHDCDCFVLPSLYEGQPMVILEALTLGKPVIATDIPGSRSALDGGYGHIVPGPAAADTFAGAMRAFCEGDLAFKAFDAEGYNQSAVSDFHAMISVGDP